MHIIRIENVHILIEKRFRECFEIKDRMKRKISVISSEKNNWKGEIEILNRNDKAAYVKWVIYDQNNKLVASFTNNYFIGNREYGDNEIFSLVKDRILNYRVKRKKIFENIIFI